ncbi:M90 family metallopeptidase [Sulfurimonas sp. HSL-1716]|uniref:M90 family metallopeptidase n=1 Tax=Hydrocurvibacter sulfurireducens TaxID=3131937 RepID=UPI0031F83F8D
MDYYFSFLILLLEAGGGAVLLLILYSIYKRYRLKNISNLPFLDEYEEVLMKTPHYKRLSQDEKERIQRSILLFVNTKEFIGVHLNVTTEMKLIIGFYACLLLLNINTQNCYDNLKTIIIYPNTIITKEIKSNGGVYTNEKFFLEGQSINDTVVISWHEAKKEAYHLHRNNVIIHEFAHEIDFMDGEIDGIPPLQKSKYASWAHTLQRNFKVLSEIAVKNREWGKYKLIGGYAATNEAEFFAVLTEIFFEKPDSLKKNFPDLYNELRDFYKIEFLR